MEESGFEWEGDDWAVPTPVVDEERLLSLTV